jgi:hypothetical protein
MDNLEDFDDTYSELVYDSECIRKKSNWTKSDPKYKLDSESFDSKLLLKSIKDKSPKLHALLKKIKDLDKADMKRDKQNYKHFIFCDVKSSNQGARMLASAFLASGYNLGYTAKKKGEKSDYSPKPKSPLIKKTRPDTPRPPLAMAKARLPKSFKSLEEILEESESDSEEEIESDKKSPKSNSPKIEGGDGSAKKKPAKKRFEKIELLSDYQLRKTKGENFYLLSSVDVFDQPINVVTKKQMLSNYNRRPDNVHGQEIRFIIMDSGFKEGIDLFDVKYVHIFEPPVNTADQKQVIGRGTRTCGQQGLEFHPTKGWPLHVFIYDISIPSPLKDKFLDSESAFEFYIKSLNMDMKLINFAEDIEKTAIFGSVDYELNKPVHEFSTDKMITGGGPKRKPELRKMNPTGPPILLDPDSDSMVTLPSGLQVPGISLGKMNHNEMRSYIRNYFKDTQWTDVKMENLCDESAVPRKRGGARIIQYTPTQRFVKKYFSPQAPVNGMLLWHSTGTGKTCSAIAAASANFARQGYTILWVTRTTLKNDIWKNMFDLICNEEIRTMVSDGVTIPEDQSKRMKLLSDAWKIRPISYKQFSNLVSKQNSYYQRLVDINGKVDPLRKTLLIIDEAHKLYGGGDLSTNERPDMKALHASLMNSYAISGNRSVKLLLMTATPITEHPIELVKLINLCKPLNQQLPDKFPLFSNAYLDENGRFTQNGKREFLDIISGHISYLNREKDARQFAQPKIEKIEVPMIDNMQEIKDMDKRMNREIINKDILELKDQIDKEAAEIDDDFKDLESSRFYELRDICEEFEGVVQKGCMKIANDNIRNLIKEAKSHIQDIKDRIKKIREELKSKNEYRKKTLSDIKERYDKDPERLSKFMESVYYVLKYSCAKIVKKSRNITAMVNQNPEVLNIQLQLDLYDERMVSFDRELKIMLEKHRLHIKELREMIKTGELNRLETFVVKDSIKLAQTRYKENRKTRKSEISKENKDIRKTRNKLSRKLMKLKTTLKRDIREDIKDKKQDKKQRTREKKQLRKTLRKQGKIRETFKDGIIKDLVTKYNSKTREEFLKAKADLEKEAKEKQLKKEAKERERQEKKRIKAEERERQKEAKEREREKKRKEKEAEKTRKKREKEREKEQKRREKELRKTQKKKSR